MNIFILLFIIISIYMILKYIPDKFNSKIYIENKIPKLNDKIIPDNCNLFCDKEVSLEKVDELIENEFNKLETIGNINIFEGGISEQEYGFEYNCVHDNIDINKSVKINEIDNLKLIDDNVSVSNNLEISEELSSPYLKSKLETRTPNYNSIVMWLHNKPIPEGWKVCDGNNYIIYFKSGEVIEVSTPNLIDKYIYGVRNNNDEVNKFGGNENLIINKENLPNHQHLYQKGKWSSSNGGIDNDNERTIGYDEVSTGECEECNQSPIKLNPPYYGIIFIIKLYNPEDIVEIVSDNICKEEIINDICYYYNNYNFEEKDIFNDFDSWKEFTEKSKLVCNIDTGGAEIGKDICFDKNILSNFPHQRYGYTGSYRDCEDYNESPDLCNDIYASNRNQEGKTALEMCCACDGGNKEPGPEYGYNYCEYGEDNICNICTIDYENKEDFNLDIDRRVRCYNFITNKC